MNVRGKSILTVLKILRLFFSALLLFSGSVFIVCAFMWLWKDSELSWKLGLGGLLLYFFFGFMARWMAQIELLYNEQNHINE